MLDSQMLIQLLDAEMKYVKNPATGKPYPEQIEVKVSEEQLDPNNFPKELFRHMLEMILGVIV